eukprot:1057614-Lingulodinium_polyedra.AAC.1
MRSNRPCTVAAAGKSHVCARRARQTTGARVECASVRFASRCNGGRSIRPHGCVAFQQRCAAMR